MSSTLDNAKPVFKPFEWVSEPDQADTGRYSMLSTIRDLASGVALTLQLVERAELARESGCVPIIDSSSALRFTRMSIAAMNVIEGYIDEHFDEMSDRGIKRRQAEKQGGQAQ